MNTMTNDISVVIVIIFDNLFLKGLLMKINRPSNTDVKVRIGNANIGSTVNIAIIMQYVSLRK